jgi:hypothetical protein
MIEYEWKRPKDIDLGPSDRVWLTRHSDINSYPKNKRWMKKDLMI